MILKTLFYNQNSIRVIRGKCFIVFGKAILQKPKSKSSIKIGLFGVAG
jgi:hypothetical protein